MVITPFVSPRRTRVPQKLLLLAGLLGIALSCSGCYFFVGCGLWVRSDYEMRPDGVDIQWRPGPRRRTRVTVRWSGDARCYGGETTRILALPGSRNRRWLDLARMNVPIGSPYTQHCNWTVELKRRYRNSEVYITATETDIWFDPTSPGYEARQARYSGTPPPRLSKP